MQTMFPVGPLKGYLTRPIVFCSSTECSAVEDSAEDDQPMGKGGGRISIFMIRNQKISSEDITEE
jgi:hypothetical protein